MKKLLMTATALFVVGGVTAAVADVSISGNARYHYETWSDDNVDNMTGANNTKGSASAEIWIKGTHTADSGLAYGAYMRLKNNENDKFYLDIADDWGKITLGAQHSPAYAMSLGADWRGTITGGPAAGATRDSKLITVTNVSTSGKDPKVIYHSPVIGGFQLGVSMTDAGEESKGNSTEFVAQYTMPDLAGASVKVGYINASQKHKDDADASVENKNSEMGVQIDRGKFMGSFVSSTMKATPKKTTADLGVTEQKASEVEVAYSATDKLLVNLVHFRSKMNKSVKHKDDKYNSTAIGAKYTVAPGFYVSLSHTSFKYTDKRVSASVEDSMNKEGDNKGSLVKLRVNVDF